MKCGRSLKDLDDKSSGMEILIPKLSPKSTPRTPLYYLNKKPEEKDYESIKRELKIKPIYECRCDGRLQTKRFTRLSSTESFRKLFFFHGTG
jgi:hypothetical protein